MSTKALELIEKERLEKTGKLDLGQCGLTTIPAEVFDLTWLEELSFCNRRWHHESNAWEECANSGEANEITDTELPTAFKRLSKLRKFYFGGDWGGNWQLRNADSLFQNKSLQYLYLRKNQLQSADFLKKMKALRYLDISFNTLEDLCGFQHLSSIEFLYLNHNKILDIDHLSRLTTLRVLNLNENVIRHIGGVGEMTALTFLSFNNNDVTDVKPLEHLSRLSFLEMSNNQFTDISCLANLMGLQSLILNNNQVENAKCLEGLVNLNKLIISFTEIKDLTFLSRMRRLEWLEIINLRIDDFSPVSQLTALLHLDLSLNAILDISFLSTLTALQYLDVKNNQIVNLAPLENLEQLQYLDIRNNAVRDIKVLLPLLKQGLSITTIFPKRGIRLANNPIVNPPWSIIEKGSDAVVNWFQQAREQGGMEKFYEAKLIIVGEPGAGKTTLMRKLIDRNYSVGCIEDRHSDSTVGINIYNGWYFPHPEERYVEFSSNLWDFGGQEIQYMTHQFFLTPSALYVLVADDRKQHTNFPYWFETIHLLGKDDYYQSPILVVLNENKHQSIKNFDYQYYVNRFKETDIKMVDVDLSVNDARYDTLCQKIQGMLCKLKHVGDEVPKQWAPIRAELRILAETRNHITEAEFFQLCARNKVEKEEHQLLISMYLHKLGSILHFQEDSDLRDFIILKPQWAVDAVYGVLENDAIAESGGLFGREDLEKIWSKYNRDEKYKLLNLMKRDAFEICYQVAEGKYIAAQLLNKIRPEFKWYRENILKFRYRYRFMPKGIITRFIVRKSQDIESVVHGGQRQSLVWDKGVVLTDKRCRALVVEELSKEGLNVIDIAVSGVLAERKYYLKEMRKEIEGIHQKWFRNVDYESMVPCVCDDCKQAELPTFFEYNTLIKYRDQNAHDIDCANVKIKKVNVVELLEGVYDDKELAEAMVESNQSERTTGAPVQNINVTVTGGNVTNTNTVSAKAHIENNISFEFISNLLSEAEMLREDIEDERRLLRKDLSDDELDVSLKEIEKMENAVRSLEQTNKEGKAPEPKSKKRLQRFMEDMGDENTALSKILRGLRRGKDYAVGLAKAYNGIAENIGLPMVPKIPLAVVDAL